jgi:hypothetical protein
MLLSTTIKKLLPTQQLPQLQVRSSTRWRSSSSSSIPLVNMAAAQSSDCSWQLGSLAATDTCTQTACSTLTLCTAHVGCASESPAAAAAEHCGTADEEQAELMFCTVNLMPYKRMHSLSYSLSKGPESLRTCLSGWQGSPAAELGPLVDEHAACSTANHQLINQLR